MWILCIYVTDRWWVMLVCTCSQKNRAFLSHDEDLYSLLGKRISIQGREEVSCLLCSGHHGGVSCSTMPMGGGGGRGWGDRFEKFVAEDCWAVYMPITTTTTNFSHKPVATHSLAKPYLCMRVVLKLLVLGDWQEPRKGLSGTEKEKKNVSKNFSLHM